MSSYQASVGSIASADKEPSLKGATAEVQPNAGSRGPKKDGKPMEPYGNLWKPMETYGNLENMRQTVTNMIYITSWKQCPVFSWITAVIADRLIAFSSKQTSWVILICYHR